MDLFLAGELFRYDLAYGNQDVFRDCNDQIYEYRFLQIFGKRDQKLS